MKIRAIKTRIFKENEDLLQFILKYVKKLPENSVLVITSKIVSLSEGRTVTIDVNSDRDKVRKKIIRDESEFFVPNKNSYLTIKDGMVMSSAGIDESNGNGKIILLPKNSFKTAEIIRQKLKKKFKIKKLGVLITDSRRIPFRAGIFGATLGYAGFNGLNDFRGRKDIFGRVLKSSIANVADSLAIASVLCLGEGEERQPLALINNAPIIFKDRIDKKELIVDIKDDLYIPLFRSIFKK